MTAEELVRRAKDARARAYSPYSGCKVGAALLTRDGKVYEGCNIENAAYSPSCCAERVAFFRAVSEGKRTFSAIAIVGGRDEYIPDIFPPCGVCRQVMAEFCTPDFLIYMGTSSGITTATLGELLPYGFGPENLKGGIHYAHDRTD